MRSLSAFVLLVLWICGQASAQPALIWEIFQGLQSAKLISSGVLTFRLSQQQQSVTRGWSFRPPIVIDGVYYGPATLLIEGLGDPFKIETTPGQSEVDLKMRIISMDNALSEATIKISCDSCKRSNPKTIPINAPPLFQEHVVNLREIQAELKHQAQLAAEQLALAEKIKADKQAEEQRLADERRRLAEERRQTEIERIASEGDGTPDDISCQKKSLKPSSPAYLKCRTSIVEQREKDFAAIGKKFIADQEREAKHVAAKQALEEKKRKDEAARIARIIPIPQKEITSDERLSLDASKVKCTDLGFKPGTEAHGKCVLQLSK